MSKPRLFAAGGPGLLLLTSNDLEKLTVMADAMNSIAGDNLPLPGVERLSDRVRRLRTEERHDFSDIQKLAEELTCPEVLQWVEALEPCIGSRARVSEVLARKRRLTLDMIRRLHKQLGIPAEVLLAC